MPSNFPEPSQGLSMHELEFVAEDIPVWIVPNFTLKRLDLVQGTFGPFKPQQPLKVPLWVALELKRSKRCRIKPPDWLDVKFLEAAVDLERSETSIFKEMPSHFVEVSMLLLQTASEDIEDAQRISSLLNSLESIRSSKLRESFYNLSAEFTSAKLNNLCLLEVNNMRSYILKALDAFYELEHAADEEVGEATLEDVLEESQDLEAPLRPFRS